MSEFEFVQITFAIILGLGVTSVLSSIAEQLKSRNTKPVFALQLFSQSVLLLLIFLQLWGFWAARDIEWNIVLFLVHALSPICYAIAAYSSRVDLVSSAPPLETQYFSNRPVIYGAWLLASLFGFALTFFYINLLQPSVPEALPLLVLRFVDLMLLATLFLSTRRIVHWACLSGLLLVSSTILVSFFLELE